MKRIFSIFMLVVALLATVALLSSCDREEKTSVGLKFELNEDGESYTVVGIGVCLDDHIVIDTYRRKPITAVADSAFITNKEIKSLTIGNTVKTIGKYAFASCTSLESISLGNSLESIDANAFYNCTSLTAVTFPDSLVKIGPYAFQQCKSLADVDFGYSLRTIGAYAFSNCYTLYGARFDDALTEIGDSAFKNCKKLVGVTFGKGIRSIGDSAFSGCSEMTLLSFSPADLRIGENAFYFCTSLETLKLPEGLLSIDFGAFSHCRSLVSVDFGSTVNYIGSESFFDCTSLTSIKIPDSVETLSAYSFQGCDSVVSVDIPFVGIYSYGTENAHLGNMFGSSDATNVPTTLTSVTIRGGGTLDDSALAGCTGIKSVVVGDKVTAIGARTFSGCSSLESVTLSDSVKNIGNYAFIGCTSLSTVTFGSGIKKIGASAFRDSALLKTVNISDLSKWCSVSLSNVAASPFSAGGATLYVDGSPVYDVVIPENVTTVNSWLFNGANIRSVTLHDRVESVGSNAFDGCANFKYNEYGGARYLGTADNPYFMIVSVIDNTVDSVRIHDNTRVIGRMAFDGCEMLESVIIPAGIEVVSHYAFRNCLSLKSVRLGSNVRMIGYMAFDGCTSLTQITVGATENWRVSLSPSMTDPILIAPIEMSTPQTLIEYLVTTYTNYYWKVITE